MAQLSWEYGRKELPVSLRSVKWYRAVIACTESVIPETHRFTTTIIFVDDPKIAELNGIYRNLPRRTDVLSFYYPPESSLAKGEGELFISVPMVIRQASRYRTTLEKEMARLIIHGTLHLFDYDHMKAKERLVMRGYERKAMNNCKREGLV